MGASVEEQSTCQIHARRKLVNVRTVWKKRVAFLALVPIFLVLGQGAWAQEYPTQSINLLIDRPPGCRNGCCCPGDGAGGIEDPGSGGHPRE